jgi:hypothetical protein
LPKLYHILKEWKMHPYKSKPAFLGWRSAESRRISSYNNLPTIIILENALN